MNGQLKQIAMSCALVLITSTANIHAQSTSAREQYRQGEKLFNKGQVKEALELLKSSAGKGYGPAMNALGYCYQYGKGVSKNHTCALQWYRNAVVQGDATGAYNYGWMHLKGVGVEKNNAIARKYLTIAANAGHADAKKTLKQEGWLNTKASQPDKPAKHSSRRIHQAVRNSSRPTRRPESRSEREPEGRPQGRPQGRPEGKSERKSHTTHNWRTGSWDSTINNLSEHPKTVVLRINVVDKETRLPIRDVQVSFAGEYWIGPRTSRHPEGERRAREVEYKTNCRTGAKGIVVGAFNWHKQYPWRFGIDEVEKAQRIEIRHRHYRYVKHKTPFHRFLEVGQTKSKPYPTNSDTGQHPSVFRKFETAWQAVCSRPYAKLVILDLGEEYEHFDQKESSRSELFEKVYAKQWGDVFERPQNRMRWGDGRKRSWCGPYLVYSIEIRLERVER